jgi:hypothetical protein
MHLRHPGEIGIPVPACRHPRSNDATGIWLRGSVLALLVALAALSTFAKISQYHPQRTQIQFVNIASKMKAAKSLAVTERALRQPSCNFVSERPTYSDDMFLERPAPSVQPLGLIVSPDRRPPPVTPS